MARLFISLNNRDMSLGKKLQCALEQRQHVMTLSVDAKPAGRWEEQLLRGVHNADAFISLLTRNGVNSSWVMGQTGMAASCEFTKQMLVLPVCPPTRIPNFVAAFHCFFLTGKDSSAIEKLASDLDEAIAAHQARRPPRIFISHRHKDVKVASKLIDLLESAFHIDAGQIRCTSVPGYKLPVGAQSAESLKTDLNGAEIVMGLIGRDTAKSDYVLFELGASWGLGKPTFPLRIAGASFEHIPEVLREKSSLLMEDVAQCLQLVEDVGRVSSLRRKSDTTRARAAVLAQAKRLALAAKTAAR
jgi:TIR domain-containing protein